MKMIVASTYRRFLTWCMDNDVNPRDPQFRFVTNSSKLRGLGSDVEIICVGDWTARPDWLEIHRYIQYLRASGRVK